MNSRLPFLPTRYVPPLPPPLFFSFCVLLMIIIIISSLMPEQDIHLLLLLLRLHTSARHTTPHPFGKAGVTPALAAAAAAIPKMS